jgi:predicted sugar kinase
MSADTAGEICRRTLMQILPGAAEADFAAFGDGVSRVQQILGDYFASAQGGGRFTSPAVSRVAGQLASHGASGIGQSSWGPTGFVFSPDPDHAEFLARRVGADREAGVEVKICNARDRGAEIREEEDVSIQ